MRKALTIALVLALAANISAQFRQSPKSVPMRNQFTVPQGSGILRFINPNNLQMAQSYSFMFSTSSYGSAIQGLYFNSMRYRISDPLILNVNLGIIHQPYSSLSGYTPQSADFIGGVQLEYHPSENVGLYFGFNHMPLYSYYPYYHNYSRYSPRIFEVK